ncbi:MAG TPA: hypothetical protein VGG22_06900 [Candidatus Baltobacteraceae bacterium]|jgi:hypothetical protein
MRPLFVAIFAFALLAGALGLSGRRAVAQMPPATAPPVASVITAGSAIEGTLTSVGGSGAVLQTPSGQSVNLAFRPRGYLLVDPSPQALSAGMRVFAVGFARTDGTIDVGEIDVLVPTNLLLVTPAPAQT